MSNKNQQHSDTLEFLATIVLVITGGISTWFTINLMMQQNSVSLLEKIISSGLGGSLAIGELIMIGIAYFFFRIKAFIASMLSFLTLAALIAISIASSFLYQININSRAINKEKINNEDYQLIRNSIKDMDIEISLLRGQVDSLNEQIKEKRNHPYYNERNPLNKRSIDSEIELILSDINSINKDISSLINQKKALSMNNLDDKNIYSSNINKGFEVMAELTNLPTEEFKSKFFWSISLIIECLMLITALFKAHSNASKIDPENNGEPTTPDKKNRKTERNFFNIPRINIPDIGKKEPITLKSNYSTVSDVQPSSITDILNASVFQPMKHEMYPSANPSKQGDDLLQNEAQKDIVEYSNPNINNPLCFHIGKRIENNQDIYIDLAKSPHMIIAGVSGFGKGNLLKNIIYQISKRDPNEIKMLMTDLKEGATAFLFENMPHLIKETAINKKDAISMLDYVCRERKIRQEFLVKNKYESIHDYYMDNKTLPFPYIVFIIDEVATLTDGGSKSEKNEVFEKLLDITAKARSAGIHAILSTQYPDAEIISTKIRMNCPDRVCFYVEKDSQSRVILGEPGAEKINEPGIGLFKQRGHLFSVKTPLFKKPNNEQPKENMIYNQDTDIDIPSNVVKLFDKKPKNSIEIKEKESGIAHLKKILDERTDLGYPKYTQQELANIIGVGQGTISKWLRRINSADTGQKATKIAVKNK